MAEYGGEGKRMILKTDADIAAKFPTVSVTEVARLRVLLHDTTDSLSKWFTEQTFGDCRINRNVVSALAIALLTGKIKNVGNAL